MERPGPVVFPVLVALGTGLLLALVPLASLGIEESAGSVFVLEKLAPGPTECGWSALPAALEIFLLGLAAGPLAVVESRAARRAPTLARDLVALLAAVVLAGATFAAGELELCYVMIQVWTGSLAKTFLASSSGLLGFFQQEVRDTHPIFAGIAVPLLLGMLLRLRGRPPRQVALLAALLASSLPVAAWILTGFDATLLRYIFFMGGLGALTPLVHEGAAWLEPRLIRCSLDDDQIGPAGLGVARDEDLVLPGEGELP
jgi:hypothetical protein